MKNTESKPLFPFSSMPKLVLAVTVMVLLSALFASLAYLFIEKTEKGDFIAESPENKSSVIKISQSNNSFFNEAICKLVESGKKASCEVEYGSTFELFKESYQDQKECNKLGIPVAMGGCFLKDVFFDEKYVKKENSRTEGDCFATEFYNFKAIKKGKTEISTSGTCEYGFKFEVNIK